MTAVASGGDAVVPAAPPDSQCDLGRVVPLHRGGRGALEPTTIMAGRLRARRRAARPRADRVGRAARVVVGDAPGSDRRARLRGRQRRTSVHADRVGPGAHRLGDGGDRERVDADLRRAARVEGQAQREREGLEARRRAARVRRGGRARRSKPARRMVGGRRDARGRARGVLLRRRRSVCAAPHVPRAGPGLLDGAVRGRRPRPPALRSRATSVRGSGMEADRIGPRARASLRLRSGRCSTTGSSPCTAPPAPVWSSICCRPSRWFTERRCSTNRSRPRS